MWYIDKQIQQEYKYIDRKTKQFIFKHQNILNASDYNHTSDDCIMFFTGEKVTIERRSS